MAADGAERPCTLQPEQRLEAAAPMVSHGWKSVVRLLRQQHGRESDDVLSLPVMSELMTFLKAAADDPSLKVIVFESADPEFFIAHVDMTLGDDPHAFQALTALAAPGLNPFQSVSEAVRRQPQVTIVKLAGLARGGGAEFVAAADMSFAALGKAGIAQCEALMGIVPGGGGTQYLQQKVGRGRALEIVLGAVTPYGDGMIARVRDLAGGNPDVVLDTSPPGRGVLPTSSRSRAGTPTRADHH